MTPHQARTPNLALRETRTRLRLSQDEFATLIRRAGREIGEPNDCGKRLVQRWESGEHHTCRPVYQRALEHATGLPIDQLGFTGDTPNPAGTAQPEPVDRRTFTAAALVSGAVLTEPWARLGRALQFPARLDTQGLDLLEAAGADHFTQETQLPARHLAAHVAGHVDLLSLLLAGAADKHRTRLAVLAGESAALAGWLAWDTGSPAAARGYWQSAIHAAKQANDGPLLACVLAYLSYLASSQGDPREAFTLLTTAGEQVRSSEHAAARSWISARAAEEAALLGDSSAYIALERAMTAMDYARPDTGRPWVRFFDNARLGSMAVATYARMGHPETDSAADAVMDALPAAEHKTRAVILGDVATGRAAHGDLDAAVAMAERALDATVKGEAVLGRDRLTALRPVLAASGSAPAVELAGRIEAAF